MAIQMNPNGHEPYLSGGVCRMTKHQVADELMALRHNLKIAKHHQVAPLCAVHYALCTVHYALCTVNYAKHPDRRISPSGPEALCTMHYTLFTVHCTQSPTRQTSPPCSVQGTSF